MKRLSLSNILKAVDGSLVGECKDLKTYVKRVIIDSRKVCEGDLFIPIIGENFDGHDYIKSAFDAGAILAFTSRDEGRQGHEGCLIHEADTRIALGQLAAYYRSLFHIPVIGITGSVGKTSTKEMMASILSQKFKVHKTQGNFNNDIGLPLTLLALEQDHDVAVVELGMNHFGEIDYLAHLLKPTIGLIANIGVSHIEFLGSREGILKAKSEMVPHIADGGLLVLNGDDDLLVKVDQTYGARPLFYGSEPGFDCTLVNHQPIEGGQKITIASRSNIYDIQVAYLGEHILHNALGCILVAEALGLSKEAIIKGVKSYQPAGMRLNNYDLNRGILLIDDAYNASVDSMASALKTLQGIQKDYSRSVAILGSMFEMGDYAERGHRQVGRLVAEAKPTQLITLGEEAKWIGDGALKCGMAKGAVAHFESQEAMLASIDAYVDEDTVILLKASRGVHLEKTRDYLIESIGEPL